MKKPVIFFSHSSKDHKILSKLKEAIIKKTGKTVEVFLSSDGQSIPLGRNWVHEIQLSLEQAKIMFVFLSPNSLTSFWTFFESGFAYSKEIRVIPVGILGVDLARLSPPLSLLQGFNINSNRSLNNIIAVLNEEFSFSHEEDFSVKDYKTIFQTSSQFTNSKFGNKSNLVRDIGLSLTDKVLNSDRELIFRKIEHYLKNNSIEYQLDGGRILTYGLSFHIIHPGGGKPGIEIHCVPDLTSITFQLIDKILLEICIKSKCEIRVDISFIDEVGCYTEKNQVSSRMYGSSIHFGENKTYKWENLNFRFDNSITENYTAHLFIYYKGSEIKTIKFDKLIDTLFELNIFYTMRSNQENNIYNLGIST